MGANEHCVMCRETDAGLAQAYTATIHEVIVAGIQRLFEKQSMPRQEAFVVAMLPVVTKLQCWALFRELLARMGNANNSICNVSADQRFDRNQSR